MFVFGGDIREQMGRWRTETGKKGPDVRVRWGLSSLYYICICSRPQPRMDGKELLTAQVPCTLDRIRYDEEGAVRCGASVEGSEVSLAVASRLTGILQPLSAWLQQRLSDRPNPLLNVILSQAVDVGMSQTDIHSAGLSCVSHHTCGTRSSRHCSGTAW